MQIVSQHKIIALATILVAVVAGIWLLERPIEVSACTHTGSGIHDLVFSDGEGSCTALGEFRAPVTVFNVWASWCPFCVDELPDFGIIAEEFPAVPVVAINRAERVAEANAFLDTIDVSDKVVLLFDPEDAFYKYIEGFGMPETVFVDESGAVLLHKRGVMSLEEMRETLELFTNRAQPNAEVENKSLCLGDGDSCRVDAHTL